MIAKLSVGSSPTNRKQHAAPSAPANSSAQSKRKRAKLIDLLLNTNWSKSSQQANNLVKLNKILLICDANFLDEKTGESPLSLAISQISETIHGPAADSTLANKKGQHQKQQQQPQQTMLTASYCPQSASLFSLQYQFSGTNGKLMLQKISTNEICQSDAPLIERIILLLIKSGALIDFRNSDGRTPLHVAAMKSNFWALKILLDLGASTNYLDINGLTPLYYSILHKAEIQVTQLLLNYTRESAEQQQQQLLSLVDANGSNPNAVKPAPPRYLGVTDQHGWQEVHQACKLGLEAHLDKLIYFGCDMNAKISGSGNTPLHVAAINDQLECAKVLLLRGADKSIINNSHQTAHQVAVISNNMKMAEFIASHNPDKVVSMRDRPMSFHTSPGTADRNSAGRLSYQSSARSSLVNSQSSASVISGHQHRDRVAATIQSELDQRQIQRDSSFNQAAGGASKDMMNPLTLDVAHSSRLSTISSSGNSSGNGSQPQSLLSIGTCNINGGDPNQLNVQVTNISPCLSQRSCATSNTTSSSGVCCDADGPSNLAEELQQSKLNNLNSQHSNVTIISIGDQSTSTAQSSATAKLTTSCTITSNKSIALGGTQPIFDATQASGQISVGFELQGKKMENSCENEEDNSGCQSSSSSTASSINGLYSLISEDRPLFAGTIVEAISEYQSGDPSHLQLNRGDLIEVMEFTPEQLQSGQWPRLANKPMIFGRRQSDSRQGLFPSFCVQRTKHQKKRTSTRICHRSPLADVTNGNSTSHVINEASGFSSSVQADINKLANDQTNPTLWTLRELGQNVRDKLAIPESQSMIDLDTQIALREGRSDYQHETLGRVSTQTKQQLRLREIEVTLKKVNDGFGFVLRGARVDPATLTNNQAGGQPENKFIIDERLMMANNLLSLQYLDEIEIDSVAHQAGLRRGDFLLAVNHVDVRFSSHEQVVQMIRQSGDQVHLKIASPLNLNRYGLIQTTTKKKPEPPKRDPNTTLTRHRAQRAKANHENSQQLFNPDKPLPNAPRPLESPTGSLNHDMARSASTNLVHFNSTQSLTCQSLANSTSDTLSITSTSTIGVDQQQAPSHQQSSHHPTPTLSSSSTTTLTTVATMKPKAPPKPSSMLRDSSCRDVCSSQTTYQPAVITTTKRGAQQSPVITDLLSKQKEDSLSSSSLQVAQNNQNSLEPPAPPPPPPPLPNFSDQNDAKVGRINQRRISAPVNRFEQPVVLDSNRIMKKRESLAAIGTSVNSIKQTLPEMGSVAAACAAAANNRLQRQQLEQKKKDHREEKPTEEETKPPSEQPQKPEIGPKPQSLTLGRKSSAQIIQQPKQQSQTLRVSKTKSRPEIPNYDELPAPPPPLPALSDEWRLDQDSRPKSGQFRCQLHANAQHDLLYQTGCLHQPDTCINANELSRGEKSGGAVGNGLIDQRRITHDFALQQQQQKQQLLMLHRQQVMRQQLRQQQLIQQHQQHLRIQQQLHVQPKEPLVADANSCITAVHHAMSNEPDHHHDHHHIAQYYNQHNHHHHHSDELEARFSANRKSSNADRTTAATRHQDQQNVNLNHQHLLLQQQRQQQQQILMKMGPNGVTSNPPSHSLYQHHHHHHHHHHHDHKNSHHQFHQVNHNHHPHPHSHKDSHAP